MESRMCFHWLKREERKAGGLPAESWKYLPEDGLTRDPPCRQTYALALLGLLSWVADLFWMRTMELEAEDNGSGKLEQLYRNLGFIAQHRKDGRHLPMHASLHDLIPLAPARWQQALMPPSFSAWTWLSQLEPRCCTWLRPANASQLCWIWPAAAFGSSEVKAELRSRPGSDAIEVSLLLRQTLRTQRDLASLHGEVKLTQRRLHILAQCNTERSATMSYESELGQVSAPAALLGALLLLAHGLGAKSVQSAVGITATQADAEERLARDGACDVLFAQQFCASSWRAELPTEAQLFTFAKLCFWSYCSSLS